MGEGRELAVELDGDVLGQGLEPRDEAVGEGTGDAQDPLLPGEVPAEAEGVDEGRDGREGVAVHGDDVVAGRSLDGVDGLGARWFLPLGSVQRSTKVASGERPSTSRTQCSASEPWVSWRRCMRSNGRSGSRRTRSARRGGRSMPRLRRNRTPPRDSTAAAGTGVSELSATNRSSVGGPGKRASSVRYSVGRPGKVAWMVGAGLPPSSTRRRR